MRLLLILSRLFVVGCLVVVTPAVEAATHEEDLIAAAKSWDGKMAPEKAVPLLREIVELLKKEKPSDLLHTMMMQLASNLEFVNEIDEADKVYSAWSESVATSAGLNSYAQAVVLVKWAMLLVNDERAEKAEVLLRRALPIIEAKDPGGEDMVFTLQQLETVAVKQAKWKDAEELRKRYLDLVEQKHGRESEAYALALTRASGSLRVEDRHDECEEMARRSVEYFERTRTDNAPTASRAYSALGNALMGLRRWAEAEAAHQKAYAIDVKQYGKEDIRSGAAINNLASSMATVAALQDDKERLDKAEAMHRVALMLAEKTFGSRHPQVALALGNLSQVLQSKGKFTEAESILRRAVDLESKGLPEHNPRRVETKMALVRSVMELGRLKEAETMCEQTLEEARSSFGNDHAVIGEVMHTRGKLLARLGRSIEAEQCYWEAMKIREKALGKDHPDVAASLFNLALLVQARKDFKNPESMFRRVIAINAKAYGKDDIRLGYDMFTLAENLILQKRWADAREQLTKVMALFEKSRGKEHHFYGDALVSFAAVLDEEKNYAEEEKVLRQALSIHQKSLGDTHNKTATSMIRLAMALRNQEKLIEAEKVARAAFLIFSTQVGTSKLPAETLGNISDVYFVILSELHYPRHLILERIDLIHEGTDPGSLPSAGT